MAKITKEAALLYHSQGKPGKIEVVPTKPYSTQTDLSLAYSPGVAEPCLEIEKNPQDAYKYTAKGNLVAVISNGTAVLGLGDIGAMAGKPVMEGKGLLFKIYGGIDVFDIEVNEKDPEKFIQAVKAIAPTFGGINLEDIKAPECFEIERRLKEELDIPVMHDDQHGTAIISAAGLLNALEVGTILPIHRHRNSSETQILLRGKIDVIFYDDNGAEVERFHLDPRNGMYAVNVPIGQWHNLEVIEPAVIFEAKDGAYTPLAEEDVI